MKAAADSISVAPIVGAHNLGFQFGSHLSIAGGMYHAVESAVRLGFNAVQVFVKNQRQWRAPPLRPDDVEHWLTLRAATNFGPVVAHATYLVNLASANPALREQSRHAFSDELRRCQQLDIPHLVVHPGSAVGGTVAAAIQNVADCLNRIFDESPDLRTMVLLETTAGQGASLGARIEELGEIIRRIAEPQRIGVCFDTCHVFAAGYDIRDAEKFRALMSLADAEFGLQRVRCWHLNDSKGDCGSRIDRHDQLGAGKIGHAGFANVLAEPRFRDVPMILETPKEQNDAGEEWDTVNLATLRRLAAEQVQR